jgi:transcriptional regulator with XRE-family HTH domain
VSDWKPAADWVDRSHKSANPPTLLKSIAEGVRVNRRRRGLTQEQLAQQIGVHVTTISRIERGTLDFSVVTFFAIVRALKFSPEVFFPDRVMTKRKRGRPKKADDASGGTKKPQAP